MFFVFYLSRGEQRVITTEAETLFVGPNVDDVFGRGSGVYSFSGSYLCVG